MAKITRETLLHLAELARLEIPEAEIPARLKEFSEIVAYVEQLNKVPTEGIEPTAQVKAEGVSESTPLAADVPAPSFSPDEAVKNSPARQDHFFLIPRVIGEEEQG